MDANAPLRRSTRCRRPTYGIGDVVEITHGSTAGGISIGRLVSKVLGQTPSADSSDEGGTAWVVSFKESSRIVKDEMVPEKAFTRVVKQANPEDDSWRKLIEESASEGEVGKSELPDPDSSGSTTSFNTRRTRRRNSQASLGSQKKVTALTAKRSKSDTTTTTTTGSDEINNNQANVHVLAIRQTRATVGRKPKGAKSTYATRFTKGNSPRNLKRKAANEMIAQQKKRQQQAEERMRIKKDDSTSSIKQKETVVEVKMNTGTLYLYRGLNPRAVFVRKY